MKKITKTFKFHEKLFESNLRRNHCHPEYNMKKLLKCWIKDEENPLKFWTKHDKIFKFMSNLTKRIKKDVSGHSEIWEF